MRVGVVAEGPADIAVIRSIVKATLGLDAADVDQLRPELQTDESSLGAPGKSPFGGCEVVKEECVKQSIITTYLTSGLQDTRLVVVQIDTAECEHPNFGATRPDKSADAYVTECRRVVALVIETWTAGA